MRTAISTFLVLAALAGTAAAVPTTLSFTARLTDGATPVEGPVDLHVAVFDAPTAGTMVWEETHAGVVASRGLVYASLGGVDPVNNGIDASVFSGAPMFIELTVDGDVLSPRIPVASVPYAVKAGVAESLEGFDPGSIITGVTAGTGLTGGGAAGAVTLSVDTATIQSRVTGTCAAGTFITGVAANGTVTCGTDAVGTGDVTGVTAGTGLTGGGTAGAITLSVDTATIQSRVTGTCAAGTFITGVAANGTVTCGTDAVGTGDITGVTGTGGITGGGASGAVTLSIDTATIQARVTGTCAAGTYITGVAANGTVTCGTDAVGTGDITGVTGTGGITGGGASGAVTLSIDTATIQARVTGTCAAGTYITGVAANGTVTCGTDAVGTGDITDVTAGTGLTGGGAAGAITLSIATGGVTSTHLLDGTIAAVDVAPDSLGAGQIATDGVGAAEIAANAVGTSEIAAGGVTTVDIAAGAVTMSKTDAPVGYAALNSSNGSSSVYPSGDITFAENGSCMVTVEAMDLGANASFRLRPLMLHVASNASVGPTQYVPSWYASDGQTQSGYFASATAVITTNQLGTWRIGCEMPGYPSSLNCRVSWLCN